VKVDRHVESSAPQTARELKIGQQAAPRRDDDLVQVRIPRDQRGRMGLDEIGDVCVWVPVADAADGRRREDDVADLAKPEQEDALDQGSIVASSMSMTGMSSLMG
jgi:hypothetical protein